jgi:DNA end-binding protein Ku
MAKRDSKRETRRRAVWSGSISFGLVNVPVRLYSAIAEHTLHFHLVHVKDNSRIGYEKICKEEGKPVPDDEIARAFEYRKGEYVFLEDEDFEAVKDARFKTIDITDFVPYEQLDPIYFRHTYYVGPDDGADKVYVLLRDAMESSGLVAVAKFVMRDRQNLGCLRVRGRVITLEQMYFADEVLPEDEIAPGNVAVDERELRMAAQLIDSFTGDFDPEKYTDTYREALCEIIEAKRKGKEVHRERPEETAPPTDLLAALRESVERAAKGGNGRRARPSRDGDLDDLSKDDLYERAQRADIPGRSRMSRTQLLEALRK